ncbi:MAG: hypothetical protein NTY99_03350 [DPANN group archaeon]|nr:hypothetical protein [DPANN group archaeon]
MADNLEALVKKNRTDNTKIKTSDYAKGLAIGLSMPVVAIGGIELVTKVADYTNSHNNVPLCATAIPFAILYFVALAGVLPSIALYYLTPPSERVNAHYFWIPQRLVNYMNRKTAEKYAKELA